MTQTTEKNKLRVEYRAIRDQLSDSRRSQASILLFDRLVSVDAQRILTFAPFRFELDISSLNKEFARQGRLVLPKCNDGKLDLYAVEDIDSQLSSGAYGILEPIPTLCRKLHLSEVDLILVSGLAFDEECYRLGYGKGYYDALLKGSLVHTIGVGFIEQKTPKPLPRDSWDVPLTELLLF